MGGGEAAHSIWRHAQTCTCTRKSLASAGDKGIVPSPVPLVLGASITTPEVTWVCPWLACDSQKGSYADLRGPSKRDPSKAVSDHRSNDPLGLLLAVAAAETLWVGAGNPRDVRNERTDASRPLTVSTDNNAVYRC